MVRNPKSLFYQTNSTIWRKEEENAIELDVRGDAPDAIDESIIPTQHDNPRAPPFYVQNIVNLHLQKHVNPAHWPRRVHV